MISVNNDGDWKTPVFRRTQLYCNVDQVPRLTVMPETAERTMAKQVSPSSKSPVYHQGADSELWDDKDEFHRLPLKYQNLFHHMGELISDKEKHIERQRMCILHMQSTDKSQPQTNNIDDEDGNACIQKLLNKLGQCEYENEALTQQLTQQKQEYTRRLNMLSEQLDDSNKKTEAEESRNRDLNNKHDLGQKKLEKLSAYLQELPTADEYLSTRQKLTTATENNTLLKARIKDLENRMRDTRLELQSQESRISLIQSERDELSEKVQRLEQDLEIELNRPDSLVRCMQDKDKLVSENETLKRLLQKKQKTMHRLEEDTNNTIEQLRNRLEQEENNHVALMEDCNQKSQQVKQLKVSLSEVSLRVQTLIEEKMEVTERLTEQSLLKRQGDLEAELITELSACYADLRCLTKMSHSLLQGRDPDVSVLLANSSKSCDKPIETLKLHDKIKQVRQLRADIQQLHTTASDIYVDNVAENMECNQQ